MSSDPAAPRPRRWPHRARLAVHPGPPDRARPTRPQLAAPSTPFPTARPAVAEPSVRARTPATAVRSAPTEPVPLRSRAPRPGTARTLGAAAADPLPSRGDAAALAAAFGADFLSWDEADPWRRGRALAPYAGPWAAEEQLAAAGWSGTGRQRGELALPGSVVPLADDRLLVHVRVRVTPFRRLGGVHRAPRPAPDVLPFPAAAPAPAGPGWVGLDSYWYELLVPLREVDGRWRVDIGAVTGVPPLGAAGVAP